MPSSSAIISDISTTCSAEGLRQPFPVAAATQRGRERRAAGELLSLGFAKLGNGRQALQFRTIPMTGCSSRCGDLPIGDANAIVKEMVRQKLDRQSGASANLEMFGAPNGDRTRVSAVKGRRPGPLDDGRGLMRNPVPPDRRDAIRSAALAGKPDRGLLRPSNPEENNARHPNRQAGRPGGHAP